MKGPIGWLGGKYWMVKHLLPLIPPHTTYVEPFGGGAQLLFAKPPSKIEVYNDIDKGLVNFFRILRDNFDKLQRLLILSPYSRNEYHQCLDTWEGVEDPVERARRWFVVCRQSIGGMFGGGWGFSVGRGENKTSIARKWVNAIDGLPEVVERLRRVQVECYDFRKIFELYDTLGTLFYVDPPYISGSQYRYKMAYQDHEDLIDILLGISGMAIVSGYRHSIYERLDWENVIFDKPLYANPKVRVYKGGEQRRRECVWICPRTMEWLNRVRLF